MSQSQSLLTTSCPAAHSKNPFRAQILFLNNFLTSQNLPSCFTVLAEKGVRMKIGCEGGLMGQNTPTQSSRRKLHKFTFDPLNEVENPIKTLP